MKTIYRAKKKRGVVRIHQKGNFFIASINNTPFFGTNKIIKALRYLDRIA